MSTPFRIFSSILIIPLIAAGSMGFLVLPTALPVYAQVSEAPSAVPLITAIDPQVVLPGGVFTLWGTGFTSFNTVVLAGPTGTVSSHAPTATGTFVTVTVPSNTPPGVYQVVLINSRNQISNAGAVQVLAPGVAPLHSPVSPIVGQPSAVQPPIGGTVPPAPVSGIPLGPVSALPTDQTALLPPTPPFAADPVLPPTQPQHPPGGPLSAILPEHCRFFIFFCDVQASSHVYTALGDSIGAGFIALEGYVPLYRKHIEQDLGVSVDLRNRSQRGWTSSQLAAALQFDPRIRSDVAAADFITWNIGGNDMRRARELHKQQQCGGPDNQQCLREAVVQFKTNWNQILHEVAQLRKSNAVVVRTVDLYYPFVNEDQAASDFAVLRPYLDAANQHITSTSQAQGIAVAQVSLAFNGPSGNLDPSDRGFISFDRYHPNHAGHRVMANMLRLLGYGSLQQTPSSAAGAAMLHINQADNAGSERTVRGTITQF